MKKILANDGIDEGGKLLLEKAGYIIVTEKVAQENLSNAINENKFDGLTVRSATNVRKDVIDACPNLKVIGRGGVGMDNIDVEYARSKGIAVINTPAASSLSVAELVFAHLFTLVRFLQDSNRQMPAKGNTEFDVLKKKYAGGIELSGKTIGIIGIGRIGQAVTRIALGIGMKVLAHDPFVKEAKIDLEIAENKISVPLKIVSLDEVFSKSDFITVHVPGGKLISKNEIVKMKKGVILVNASRGGVIEENDLLEALNSGKVAGAGLDVFEGEPKPKQELLQHPKISFTPHIGAATKEAQERIGIELAEKIIESLK
ncbi:MAG: 3-phosphoglycerate dehydrogenase [Bacteroidetes bacterium]|nr:3-phosphoglycerate dehydrogenase [Bacteroidota bacterium]